FSFLKVVGLLCCSAFLVRSAHIPEKSMDARSLVEKILGNIPVVHDSITTPLLQSRNMPYQSMATSLGIPAAPELRTVCRPLNQIDFTLEVCLSSMSAGLQLYQDVLGELKERVTTDKVTGLLADIRDLLAQVNKMQEPGQMSSVAQYEASGLASRLPGDYEVQVATHFTLLQLRDFTQNLKRSMRNIEHLTSRSGQKG
uniref:Granulocyte colony-stimulating factor n=1 Tax=Oncorhynchus mykiss TaxID=8022 RepID=A0A8C7R3P2_ONCMY